jgi:Ca2+-binding RTX toxin-like protein
MVLTGEAGSLLVLGGSGAATVTGGAGGATLLGAAGGVVTYGNSGGAGALAYTAGSGNETLNAGLSTTNNFLNAGSDAAGHDSIVSGSGNDTLLAGAGADTLGGGGGSDLFAFIDGHVGGADVIAGFTAQDTVALFGYGSGAAATALQNAVSSGGNTTLTLADNTTITFLGVSSVAGLTGHVFST